MYNTESEQMVLSSILQENDAMNTVVEVFENPHVFYQSRHQHIFRAMYALYQQSASIDAVSIVQWLDDEGLTEDNSAYYLSQLYDKSPSAATIATHVKIVYELYQKRESRKIYHRAYTALENGQAVDDINGETQSKIDALMTDKIADVHDFQTVIHHGMDRIEKILSGDAPGWKTGFRDLDNKIQGIEPGEYIVIAGRPSQGKTAFALKLTTNLAKQEVPICFISTETTITKLGTRYILEEAGVPLEKKYSHTLARTAPEIQHYPVYTRDIGSLSAIQLRAIIKKQIHQHAIKVVVIDYIQRLHASKENRVQELREVSGTIKDLCQEYGIVALVLSQLRKDAEGHIPEMGHIRESGDIEQDADKILGIAAASKLKPSGLPSRLKDAETDELFHTTILNCCKVKDGEIGLVYLYTDPRTYTYKDMA